MAWSCGDDVGDQALVGGGVLARDHDGVRDGGVLAQHGFDLAELDAEAADLDLIVDAAEVLEVAVLRRLARSPVR